jgi:hypothetical protein
MKKVLWSAIFIFCFYSYGWTDIIHLKDGNTVEGKIRKVTDQKAYVDIDSGTISFLKNEIDWIEESKEENALTAKKEMLPSTYADELFAKARTIIEKRKKVFKIKRNCAKVVSQIDKETKKYIIYDQEISKINKELERIKASLQNKKEKANKETNEALERNFLITRNTYILKKRATIGSVKDYYEKRIEFEDLFMRNLEDVFHAEFSFNQAFLNVDESQVAPQDKYYFKEIEKEAQAFLYDFSLMSLSYEEHDGKFFVKGIINGTIPFVFLVDLLSPVVAITEEFALSLNLARTIPVGDIDISSYGGMIKYGEPTILKSIEIDGLKVKYVSTLITGELPFPHINGILGRSFFYECIVRPDTAKKKILVYKFLPSKEDRPL